MDNQHRKITGYKDFDQAKVDTINKIKAQFNQLGELMEELQAMPDLDKRALAIAKTDAQTAAMWAVRAVAQPASF